MKTLEELKEYYRSELSEDLAKMESKRRKIAPMDMILSRVTLIATALIIVLTVTAFVTGNTSGSLLFFLITSIILAVLIRRRRVESYTGDYKERILGKVIHFLEPQLTYQPKSYIDENIFKDSKIFLHSIDRYKGEDLVIGVFDGVDFMFSEVYAEYETSNGDSDTEYETMFKGLLFVADFNKNFMGETFVLPDFAERRFGGFGLWLQSKNFSRDQLIKLEDPEFEKYFVVYSNDQVESRYILSTSLIRRILEFKKKFNSPVYLSFVGSRIYVAVPLKGDMFDPNVQVSVYDSALVEKYYEDLYLGLDIIKDLNLNTRLWN